MTEEDVKLNPLKEFGHANVAQVIDKPEVIVVIATSNYIPMRIFKSLFEYIYDLANKQSVEKVIFDKRALSVFHQPSMEWYFLDWKERMYKKGCSKHRKILPDDHVFVQSASLAREKMQTKYPDKVFNQLDIQYADNLKSAIEE